MFVNFWVFPFDVFRCISHLINKLLSRVPQDCMFALFVPFLYFCLGCKIISWRAPRRLIVCALQSEHKRLTCLGHGANQKLLVSLGLIMNNFFLRLPVQIIKRFTVFAPPHSPAIWSRSCPTSGAPSSGSSASRPSCPTPSAAWRTRRACCTSSLDRWPSSSTNSPPTTCDRGAWGRRAAERRGRDRRSGGRREARWITWRRGILARGRKTVGAVSNTLDLFQLQFLIIYHSVSLDLLFACF